MSGTLHRIKRRANAKAQLEKVTANPDNVVVIHYSCQSFFDRPDGASPRITSIAVRNLGIGQTTSFSIHQIAERDKKYKIDDINANYDELEKRMLKEFYEYAEKHHSHTWLHWNMRDINYGFAAIAHRFQVLGGKPYDIHESCRYDLARLVGDLYGADYIEHPRLANLVVLNEITDLSFLNGKEEAEAFEQGEYVKLHQSTLRKVAVFAHIIEHIVDGTLKTRSRVKDKYGGYFAFAIEKLRDHWFFALLGILGAAASIIALIFK